VIQKLPEWAVTITKDWKIGRSPRLKRQGEILARGIRLLEEARSYFANSSYTLHEQPFDAHLLSCSPLFLKSRKLYIEEGGNYFPTLVSSSRTLSSPRLLDQTIEYSPIERELIWLATDRLESKSSARILELRTFASSLFHEQNHRILWRLLPSAPANRTGLRRYLNFAESLVIVTDMALGDQLGPELASLFYLTGVTYDPGTTVFREMKTRRAYRNYLQAALHSTYLNLELFDPDSIPKAIERLFPELKSFASRAAVRSGNLDPAFVESTNLAWQRKHQKMLMTRLCSSDKSVLELPEDPLDHRQQYLIAEKWFDLMGL
jgi:hypothetical protein